MNRWSGRSRTQISKAPATNYAGERKPAQDERHVVEKEKAAARYSERPLKSVPYYKLHAPLGASRAYRYQARRSELIYPARKPAGARRFFSCSRMRNIISRADGYETGFVEPLPHLLLSRFRSMSRPSGSRSMFVSLLPTKRYRLT
jgi:hypothetical protein